MSLEVYRVVVERDPEMVREGWLEGVRGREVEIATREVI